MNTMDINSEAVWQTTSRGSAYRVTVPFESPRVPQNALTVMMVCDGAAFSPCDRMHAQQCLDALPHRLDYIFSRVAFFLGFSKGHETLAAKATPTLILEAGNHKRWIFAMDTAPQAASLFVEWEKDLIVGEWIALAPAAERTRSVFRRWIEPSAATPSSGTPATPRRLPHTRSGARPYRRALPAAAASAQ